MRAHLEVLGIQASILDIIHSFGILVLFAGC